MVVTLALAGLFQSAMTVQAEPPAQAPAELTLAQREKLKERDRLQAQLQEAQRAGKLDDAIAAARKMLALEQEVFGAAHEEVAGTWELLAGLYEANGSYAEARQALQEVQKVRERLYGARDWRAVDVARALRDLAVRAGMSAAERREAVRLLLEVRALHEKALGLYQQGRYADAADQFAEALGMGRRLYPAKHYSEGHPELATILNELGFLHQARGELGQAEPFFRDALAMNRRLYLAERYPAGHPDLATSLNNLGLLLRRRGDLGQAEPLYREALAMRRRLYPAERYPTGHADLAISLNNLGALLVARGELGQAEPLYRDALAMYRRLYPAERYPLGHAHLAMSLNNLGSLLQDRGELGQAEPLLRDAVAMNRRLYPAERYPAGHPDLASTLNNLGSLLQARGELGQAEPFFRDALAMKRKLFPAGRYPAGHADLATSLNNLGGLLHARGELGQAEPFSREALAMYRRLYPAERYPGGHPHLALSLSNLGTLLQALGELGQAEPFLRDALAMDQAQLRQLAEFYGETEALNFAARLPLTQGKYLSVTRPLPSSPRVYETLWQGKGLLMRIAARRHDDLLASRHPDTRDLATQLGDIRARMARLLTQPPADVAEHQRLFRQLTERKEGLERAIAQELRRQPPPAAGPAPAPDDLRRLLPGRAVFIDFLRCVRFEHDPRRPGWKGETRTPCYVAFVLSKEQPAVRVELGPATPIERALKDWRRDIELGGKGGAEPSDADRRLARLVWQPLVAHVPADTEVVYLCPDAALTRLPWAALPGRQPGRVLLEEHALALVPHPLYLLEQLQAKPRPSADDDLLLIYGAVRYDRPPGAPEEPAPEAIALNRERGGTSHASWPYLAGTMEEPAQVRARAGRRPVLLRQGSAASLAQLLRDLPRARWAHLATHGFFDDQGTRSVLQLRPEDYERARWGGRVGVGLRNPLLLSGLVLAGADRKAKGSAEAFDPDGGILTGEGLLALPLERLDLVVLSACETGLGDVAGGEGVFGLQRAFHVAGCRNVVASLWQVGDASTLALMALFYHYLWDKELPPLQALRRAQLYLYYHPEEIPALAQERGPKRDVVAKVPDEPKPPTGEKPIADSERPKGRAAVKQWAGFLLSGYGR
jgi:CHAT domain-containing protein